MTTSAITDLWFGLIPTHRLCLHWDIGTSDPRFSPPRLLHCHRVKITARKRAVGRHRTAYEVRWHLWALPLAIGVGTSWFPTEESTLDFQDGSWLHQRVLLIDILCMRCKIVLSGPLFTDYEAGLTDEEEIDDAE